MMSNMKKRMREQGYTQTDMENVDRISLGRKNHVASPEERRSYRDPCTVVQPNHTVKTTNHLGDKQLVQWKIIDQSLSRSRWVIVVTMDMVTFSTVSMVGLFFIVALTSQHTS